VREPTKAELTVALETTVHRATDAERRVARLLERDRNDRITLLLLAFSAAMFLISLLAMASDRRPA